MTDIGFIGEDPRQPSTKRRRAAQVASGAVPLLALASFLAVAIGGLALGAIATPFHYYDAVAVVGVAIGPALMVLAGARLLAPGVGGPLKRLDVLCGLVVFFVVVPGNYLLYLNQVLDHSPAVEEERPVQDAWIRTGRHGIKSFMVNVRSGVKSPLGRWSLYRAQPIRLQQAEWHDVTPGQSVLALRIHPGRFGFAWYEPDPRLAVR